MRNTRVYARFLAIVSVGAMWSCVWAQDCSSIIPAMKLTTRETDTSSSLLSIADHLETSTARSFQELQSSSAGLGLSYAGIGVNFNGQDANSNFQAWKEAVIHDLRSQASSTSAKSKEVQTIAHDAVKAWSKCIDSTGLHVWALPDDDPLTFTVFAKYLSPDAGHPFITFTPKLTTGPGVTCDDMTGYSDPKGSVHRLGGPSSYETQCTRTDRGRAASAKLTTKLGGRVVRVPARPVCTESVALIPGKCVYPMAEGRTLSSVTTCVAGEAGKSTTKVVDNSCKDVGCRTSIDIVREVAQALYGAPGSDAEIASLAAKLDQRAIPDIPALVTLMAKDLRFFDAVLPPAMFKPGYSPAFVGYNSPVVRTAATCDRPMAESLVRKIMMAMGAHPTDDQVKQLSQSPNIMFPYVRGVPNQLCNVFEPAGIIHLAQATTAYLMVEAGHTKVPPSLVGDRVIQMCPGIDVGTK